MEANQPINNQVLYSLVKSFTGNYRQIKKWLGDAKKILIIGTKPIDDPIPFSRCVYEVLKADGREVQYIEGVDSYRNSRTDWYHAIIHHGLLKDKNDMKTIVVENNEKGVSQLPIKLAEDIIKRSKHYNPDNFRYVNKSGIFGPEQIHTLYLYQVLSKKFTG